MKARKKAERFGDAGPLVQLHHQFKDGRTEFVAQNEIHSDEEWREWTQRVVTEHPLPEGAQWLCCNQKSEHFVKTVEEVKESP